MTSPRTAPKNNLVTIAAILGTIYFGFAPLVSINQVRIGPVSLYNIVGALTVCALVVAPVGGRIMSTPVWKVTSLVLVGSCLVGLVRASEVARPTATTYLIRFLVTWIVASLSPVNRRVLLQYVIAWTLGLCVAGALQAYNEANVGFRVDETVSYSLSRYMQSNQDAEWGVSLNLFTTYGYMAMSIAAGCCLAASMLITGYVRKALLVSVCIFLTLAERRGGFIAADSLAIIGVPLAVCVILFTRGVPKLKVLGVALIALIALGVVVNRLSDFSNVSARVERMMWGGVLADESIATRYEILSVSVKSFRSNPLIGVGLVGWTQAAYDLTGLHSSLLDVPAELGVIGFVGYYGFMLAPLAPAFVLLRKHGVPEDVRLFAVIIGTGTIQFFIGSIFNPVFLNNLMNETLVLLVALGASLFAYRQHIPGRPQIRNRGMQWEEVPTPETGPSR
jgi:hypothetical protein